MVATGGSLVFTLETLANKGIDQKQLLLHR